MEENQTTPQNQEAPAAPSAEMTKKKLYNKPWFIVLLVTVGLLLLVGIPGLFLWLNSGGASGGTADKFYSMIEKTAQQSKIRYAYTLAIPKVGDGFSVDVKSLTEYDAATGEYSTAHASDAILASAARCVKGKEYRTTGGRGILDSFQEAEEQLKGPYEVNDTRFSANSCEFMKPNYKGRFTDGMLAVGLKPEQAKNMADSLRMDNPAKLTDNGMTTYKGKAARKISFEVGKIRTGSQYGSDAFFYSFRDGISPKVGANVPVGDIEKHFDTVFHVPAVVLKGFYLIDEKSNLPLYRYLETAADKADAGGYAPRTVMGEYSFPESLTMDENTQLPEITKQQ